MIERTSPIRLLICALLPASGLCGTSAAQEAVFSGPQAGEVLPSFTVRNIVGPGTDQQSDPIAAADGKPVLLIFVHKRERPAFGLANALTQYAITREPQGLQRQLVFLSDDLTETEAWIKRIPQYFEKGTPVGVSVDGAEGPGAYGLNRNVTLTVLVGKEGKVTANFALVQPSIAADGQKILKAIVDATGGGEVPDIANYLPQGMRDRTRPKPGDAKAPQDGKLRELLRGVIQKDATAEDVEKAAKAVEAYVVGKESARVELGQIAGRVVGSPKFADYGTAPARKQLKVWAKKYSKPVQESNDPGTSPKLPSRSESEGS